MDEKNIIRLFYLHGCGDYIHELEEKAAKETARVPPLQNTSMTSMATVLMSPALPSVIPCQTPTPASWVTAPQAEIAVQSIQTGERQHPPSNLKDLKIKSNLNCIPLPPPLFQLIFAFLRRLFSFLFHSRCPNLFPFPRRPHRRLSVSIPPAKGDFPAIPWAADDRALTYAFINVLIDYPPVRRNIWPAPGERVTGKTKSTNCQEVAVRVLEGREPYEPKQTLMH